MEPIFRAASIYIFLLVLMRVSGRRTFAELTAFDFLLILIIGEGAQQALLGYDYSITNSFLVISTLVLMDVGLSYVKRYSEKATLILEGQAYLILENGRCLFDRMKKSRIDKEDILTAAREQHGLARLDQIKYAVLERSGGISIIPK